MQLKLDECDDGCMPTATAQRPEQLCIGLFGDTSMFACGVTTSSARMESATQPYLRPNQLRPPPSASATTLTIGLLPASAVKPAAAASRRACEAELRVGAVLSDLTKLVGW